MENVNFTYNTGELAWVTDELPLSGDIALRVVLKSRGYVIIKQVLESDTATVEVTPYIEDAEFKFCLQRRAEDERQYKIKVFASAEPQKIEYANI